MGGEGGQEPAVPGDGQPGADQPQPGAAQEGDPVAFGPGGSGYGRRRRPSGRHRRRRTVHQPASHVRAARVLPPRGTRPARAGGQVGDHDGHGAAAGRSVRRSGARDGRRVQVPGAEDAGDRRAHRRGGVRRLRVPGTPAGAGRYPIRPLLSGPDGPPGKGSSRPYQRAVREGGSALLRPGRHRDDATPEGGSRVAAERSTP